MNNNSTAGSSWSFTRDESLKKISHQNLGDRLPVPVTIAVLDKNMTESGEDTYRIGDIHFKTVITMGVIMEKNEENGRTIYKLHDPEDTEHVFEVVQFGEAGEGGSKFIKKNLEEDMRVRVVGKVTQTIGEKAILAYVINRVTDDKEYTIFKLEAKASKLFFEKNLIERMRRGDTANWTGMLAPPTRAQNAPRAHSPKVESPVKSNLEKATPIQKKVRAAILCQAAEFGNGETQGVPLARILQKVRTLSEEELRDCLLKMTEAGIIYEANTDEWMPI